MIDQESDIRPIGYGAMLIEGLVGIIALIAATRAAPGRLLRHQHARRRSSPTSGMPVVNLPELESAVGETVAGRTGGAVSLAVGMAQIFSGAARHARPDGLLVPLRDHVRGAVHPHHDRHRHARRRGSWCRSSSAAFYAPLARHGLDARRGDLDAARGRAPGRYFIWTGSISTIWPMFGIANQLLAVGRARGRHDDHHQQRQGALRLGHAAAARRSWRSPR